MTTIKPASGSRPTAEEHLDRVKSRWSALMGRLAEGPIGYGPHDVEHVCAAFERVCNERDALHAEIHKLRDHVRILESELESMRSVHEELLDAKIALRYWKKLASGHGE